MAVSFICRKRPTIMTVRLDTDFSDPSTWATYLDDAQGLTAGSSQFDDFFGHYPVLMSNNGGFLGNLNKNDFTKYVSGSAAPVTTVGNDTMIFFPRRGYRIYKKDEYIYISVTDCQVRQHLPDDNTWQSGWRPFNYWNHDSRYNAGFCIGAYESYCENNKMYSLPGKYPTTGISLSTARTYARNRGAGYEQLSFYPLTYLQVLYTLKYKGQNAQVALGQGYTNDTEANPTGTTKTKGMDWGYKDNGFYSVKLLGIEDFYGNHQIMVDGIICDSSRRLLVNGGGGDFNDTGAGYEILSEAYQYSSDFSGYPLVNGTTQTGFTPSGTYSGSNTKYFCDSMNMSAGKFPAHGGRYDSGADAGVYNINFSQTTTQVPGAGKGSRLMYMALADW